MRRVLLATLLLAVSACNSSGKPAATKAAPAPTITTTVANAVTTTAAAAQTSGTRTVLSPIGLNIRAQPLKTAPVVRTAAQGTALTVLGHSSDGGGGWYQVKGTTVTGWISDNATLSGAGQFGSYTSAVHQVSALYPATWTYADAPPASVVFRAPAGGSTVVMTTAANAAALGRGRSGYVQTKDESVVICGVTSNLLTFMQVTTPPTTTAPPGGVPTEHYLAQVNLALDATHALGIVANLADLSQLQPVRDILNSITFPFPRCQA